MFANYIQEKNMQDIVVVSTDTGFAKKARKIASLLHCPLVLVDKRRPVHNKAEIFRIVGSVKDKICILIDDIVDTAGTVVAAVNALKKQGALEIFMCATHPVLSEGSFSELENSNIKEIIFTDTIPIPKEKLLKNMKILSIAPLMARVIESIHKKESLKKIFTWEQ